MGKQEGERGGYQGAQAQGRGEKGGGGQGEQPAPQWQVQKGDEGGSRECGNAGYGGQRPGPCGGDAAEAKPAAPERAEPERDGGDEGSHNEPRSGKSITYNEEHRRDEAKGERRRRDEGRAAGGPTRALEGRDSGRDAQEGRPQTVFPVEGGAENGREEASVRNGFDGAARETGGAKEIQGRAAERWV